MKIKLLVLAGAALLAASCATGSPQKKEMCIQMYSARSIIGDPAEGKTPYDVVLKELSDMGYTSIEAAGYGDGKFYGDTPEVFKQKVEAAGMEVLSSHTARGLSAEEVASGDLSAALAWWDETIAAHKAAGMKYIVTPWIGPQAAATPVSYDARYPYLWWAKAHFHRLPVPPDKMIAIHFMIPICPFHMIVFLYYQLHPKCYF